MVATSWRPRWSRDAKAAATTQTVASARTSERRSGPCRVQSPRSSKETNDGKGQGGGERLVLHGGDLGEPPPNTAAGTLHFRTTTGTCLPRGRHLSLRCGRRTGNGGTVAAALSCFSMSQCCRWVVNWWICRTSCLRSSSRTLTFQFVVGQRQLWSPSHTRRHCFRLLSSYMLQQCFKHQRQSWNLSLPFQQCSKHQRQWWSLLLPAPAVIPSPAPVVESFSPAPAVLEAPAPVVDYFSAAPAVFQAPAPVIEYPAVSESPAPVEEYISPAPAGLLPVPAVENVAHPRQQLLFRLRQ